MTSVPFDLNVGILNDKGRVERYDTVEFRFTTKSARALEKAAGAGIGWIIARGQSVEALVLLVCYGLQHEFQKMTEPTAVNIIDKFIEQGGDVVKLSEAAMKALNCSGVYGKPDPEVGDEPRPTMTTESAPMTEATSTP